MNQKEETEFSKTYGMYSLMINELSYHETYLNYLIDYELSELAETDELNSDITYKDSITREYVKVIDQIIIDLLPDFDNTDIALYKNQKDLMSEKIANSYFFQGDSLTEKGELLRESKDKFRNSLIVRYDNNPLYFKRINGALTTDSVYDRHNKKFERIRYYYKDTPLIAVIMHLQKMKNNALEFELEYILKQ